LVERGVAPDNIKAAGYWRAGEADFYDGHQH
jgi:NADPH-dependent ferric siderophore reductase